MYIRWRNFFYSVKLGKENKANKFLEIYLSIMENEKKMDIYIYIYIYIYILKFSSCWK